ncbi:MAG: 30S ribosomal protein S4 [Planctomycetota bacterium]
MARQISPVCRLCRREGTKLFLKGTRCDTSKCSFERRESPPGMTISRRSKPTEYALRLREKQKVKRYYGVMERQFRNYFEQAERTKGHTGDALMILLERRLDNIIARLGLAQSRAQARLMVTHCHITINGRLLNIPSYLVRIGDVIRIKARTKSQTLAQVNRVAHGREVPDFLSLSESPELEGHVLRLPGPADVSIPARTQLIVELCSK